MHCHQAVRCPAIVAGQWPAPGHACPLWRQTAPVPGGRILVASTATARDWSSAPEPPTQHHTYRLGKAIGTNTARNTTSAQLGRPPQQSIPSCPGHPHKANGPPDPADGNTSPRPLSSRNSKRNFIYCRSKPDRRIGIRTGSVGIPGSGSAYVPVMRGPVRRVSAAASNCRTQRSSPLLAPAPYRLRPREQEGAKYSPDMHRDGVCDRRYPESAAHEELLAKARFAWVPSGITAPA
jgi:hypothetical protein